MLERKSRCWDSMTMEELRTFVQNDTTSSVWNDNLSHEMLVSSDRLAGTQLRFVFDDGFEISYDFSDARHLRWSTPDGASGDEIYNASPAPGHDDMLMLHHCRFGFELPRCMDIVFDFTTGFATAIDAALGHPDRPRDVYHTIRFGHIDGIVPPEGAVKPHFTTELNGKSVIWRHPGATTRGIQYIFPSEKYYTYAMVFPATQECWMGTNPCDYIKIREDLYLISVVEERQTGVQLNMLMNLALLRDVQTAFGISGPDEPSKRMDVWMRSNRVGRLVNSIPDFTNTAPLAPDGGM